MSPYNRSTVGHRCTKYHTLASKDRWHRLCLSKSWYNSHDRSETKALWPPSYALVNNRRRTLVSICFRTFGDVRISPHCCQTNRRSSDTDHLSRYFTIPGKQSLRNAPLKGLSQATHSLIARWEIFGRRALLASHQNYTQTMKRKVWD